MWLYEPEVPKGISEPHIDKFTGQYVPSLPKDIKEKPDVWKEPVPSTMREIKSPYIPPKEPYLSECLKWQDWKEQNPSYLVTFINGKVAKIEKQRML